MQRRPGLLAAIGLNLASLALAAVTSVVLALSCAGAVSAIGGVGLVILAVTFTLLRGLADVQRNLVGAALGQPVTRRYADLRGLGPVPRAKRWITDGALWADVGWALFTCTIGALISTLALAIVLYPIWSITWYVLWHAVPANLPQPYHFLHIAGTWRALAFTVVSAALAVAATVRIVPALTRWRLLLDASIMADSREAALEKRVSEVAAARTDTADAAAEELRRIERDLHDGPQARLAALGMELGLAEQLITDDPAAAATLIAEARASATTALSDIRGVVRGVYPPVLQTAACRTRSGHSPSTSRCP